MRLKHILNLENQQNPLSWTYLAAFWLIKAIYNLSLEYSYLKDKNKTKATNPKSYFF